MLKCGQNLSGEAALWSGATAADLFALTDSRATGQQRYIYANLATELYFAVIIFLLL